MKYCFLALCSLAVVASPAIAQKVKAGQTRAAVAAATERRFRNMDADASKSVSSAEFSAFQQKHAEKGGKTFKARRATKMFAKTDANGDGTVTLEEMKSRALAMFDARDLNKNSVIDASEMPAAAPATSGAAKAGSTPADGDDG